MSYVLSSLYPPQTACIYSAQSVTNHIASAIYIYLTGFFSIPGLDSEGVENKGILNNKCTIFCTHVYRAPRKLTFYGQDQLLELYSMAVSDFEYLVGLSSYKLSKNFGLSHKSPTTVKICGFSILP